MEWWPRYALIAIACSLIAIVSVLIYKYRKIVSKKEAVMSKEDVIGRMFLRKLRKIEDSIGKEDPSELFKRLNRTMRSFFRELFDIQYEFDYLELNEELTKKGIAKGIRDDVISYTMAMSQAEYGGHKITNVDFYPLLEKSIVVAVKVTGQEHELVAGKVSIKKEPEEEAAVPELEEAPKEKKEKAAEKVAAVPKVEQAGTNKLRRLLVEAEQSIRENRQKEALDSYSELKETYNGLNPKTKLGLYPETKRIIAIYNTLLKEYKDILTGNE
jgi:hypothetical protein